VGKKENRYCWKDNLDIFQLYSRRLILNLGLELYPRVRLWQEHTELQTILFEYLRGGETWVYKDSQGTEKMVNLMGV